MRGEPETSTWDPVSSSHLDNVPHSKVAPYETSLVSQYARLLLLMVVVPIVIGYANSVLNQQVGALCLVAGLVLLATLLTSRGYPFVRIALLVGMTLNLLALIINPNETFGEANKVKIGPTTYILLIGLATGTLCELTAWAKSSSREMVLKTLAWGALAIPAVIYIVAMPVFISLWDAIEADEKKLALKDPNWSLFNEATFRAAKFLVFSVFAYLGACLGSFLNVVAYCIPRGEKVGIRDSKCPLCGEKISRIDNLPIFSFVNLGAKCRSCRAPIPARYLLVELTVAVIFGSLFLYELVTGCANIPRMNFSHKGILWVILYPKWNLIALYFFHSLFLCAVLVLSLIELDRQRLKVMSWGLLVAFFFLLAAIYIPLQPVPLLAHLPEVSLHFAPWLEQLLKLTVGGLAGAIIGRALGATVFSASNASNLTLAFLLTGIVIGWQGLAQVTTLFALIALFVRLYPRAKWLLDRPTMLLLAALMIHHPFWNIIASWWRFR